MELNPKHAKEARIQGLTIVGPGALTGTLFIVVKNVITNVRLQSARCEKVVSSVLNVNLLGRSRRNKQRHYFPAKCQYVL
jgi:hypothetical protein